MTVRELKDKLRLLPDEVDSYEVAATWDGYYLPLASLEPNEAEKRLYLHEDADRG